MEIYFNCSYDSCNCKNQNGKKMSKCRPQSVPLGARAPIAPPLNLSNIPFDIKLINLCFKLASDILENAVFTYPAGEL